MRQHSPSELGSTDKLPKSTGLTEVDILQDRLDALGHASGAMVFSVDRSGTKIVMPDWLDLTGQSFEETMDYGWLDVVHPEDKVEVESAWRQAMECPKRLEGPYRVRTKAGEYRWFRSTVVPIFESSGEVREWIGLCHDIHNQRQAEIDRQKAAEELELSEIRFRDIFTNAGVVIAQLAMDGTWLDFNDVLCELTEYSRDELQSLTFADLTHPDDRGMNMVLVEKLKKNEIKKLIFEKRYITKSGKIVWVEVCCTFIREPDGTPKRFVTVVQNIDSRKRAEEALKESEDHYRFMVDSNPQMPWTADPKGKLIELSDRFFELTGFHGENRRGGIKDPVMHPDDVERVSAAWQHSLTTGAPYDVESRDRMRDGSYRWMRSRAVPRYDKNGNILRWYGSIEDIHQQKLTETELERLVEQRTFELNQANLALTIARDEALAASKSKSEFLANMSHEIRTPMNAVIGLTSLLIEKKLDEETYRMVKTISSSGETLLRLIDDILDLSRIEAAKLELDFTATKIDIICEDVVALLQTHAQSKNIQFRSEPPKAPVPTVLSDSIRIRQVLSNLISNAIKFTDHGEVCLKWEWRLENSVVYVRFSVMDTGAGIPQDRLRAIFESFTQADGSTQRRFGGSGLGLTIAKKIVELMGGQLSVVSEVGRGSCFGFEVGCELAPGDESPSVANPLLSDDINFNLHVLLAEDNAINVMVAENLLEHCGCTVEAAENGLRAISLAASQRFDLVLMDVQMPVCDGLEATRVIRIAENQEGRPRVPIYALTANVMSHDRQKCMDAGMDGFLAKPIPVTMLKAVLLEVYRGKQNANSPY